MFDPLPLQRTKGSTEEILSSPYLTFRNILVILKGFQIVDFGVVNKFLFIYLFVLKQADLFQI